jgi:hypothetical protein
VALLDVANRAFLSPSYDIDGGHIAFAIVVEIFSQGRASGDRTWRL